MDVWADSLRLRGFWIGVVAMIVVVTASNIAVQYPINDWLTWGAFTYPVAFLVNDLTNRNLGPAVARRVVLVGFVLGVALSVHFAGWRIGLASGDGRRRMHASMPHLVKASWGSGSYVRRMAGSTGRLRRLQWLIVPTAPSRCPMDGCSMPARSFGQVSDGSEWRFLGMMDAAGNGQPRSLLAREMTPPSIMNCMPLRCPTAGWWCTSVITTRHMRERPFNANRPMGG